MSLSDCARMAVLAASIAAFGPSFTPPASAEGRAIRGTIDPACTFFRGQAYRRAVVHFATEMMWVCETIAQRRAARIALGDQLLATETAMRQYRDAVIAAGRVAFAETRSSDAAPRIHGLSDDAKRRLAEETGALLALDAIRDGF